MLLLVFLCPWGRAGAQATYPSEFSLAWCVGSGATSSCFDHHVSCAHFQLRLERYYREGSRPPLREAFWLALLPPAYQKELLFGCPGLPVLSLYLLAEVRLYTHPPAEAAELAARAEIMLEVPEVAGPHRFNIEMAWPLQQARDRYREVALLSEEAFARLGPMSLDFVIPHCREDLSWFVSRLEVLPNRTRIFIYEKCEGDEGTEHTMLLTAALGGRAEVIARRLPDASDPRTGLAARRDECTAYLAHVVSLRSEPKPPFADATIFLHGDPGDHTPFGLLNLVLRGLVVGGLRSLGFLHLGSPRLVQVWNPCQASIFELAFGRPLQRPLATYCCSQFLVSRERLMSRPVEEYARMLRLVDGSVPDDCTRIGPSYERYAGQRLSHCFFLEFMWHVVFGEQESLPLRADDTRLPPTLRMRDNEGESLPSLMKSYVTPYSSGAGSFAAQNGALWRRLLFADHPEVAQAKQVSYRDMVVDAVANTGTPAID